MRFEDYDPQYDNRTGVYDPDPQHGGFETEDEYIEYLRDCWEVRGGMKPQALKDLEAKRASEAETPKQLELF